MCYVVCDPGLTLVSPGLPFASVSGLGVGLARVIFDKTPYTFTGFSYLVILRSSGLQ